MRTVFPTIQKRGSAVKCSGVSSSRCQPVPGQPLDVDSAQQRLRAARNGLNCLHLKALGASPTYSPCCVDGVLVMQLLQHCCNCLPDSQTLQSERADCPSHCLAEKLEGTQGHFQQSPYYKLLQQIAHNLLKLLGVVGAGTWAGAATGNPLKTAAKLANEVQQLVNKHAPQDPSGFDVNCILAVQYDRGEFGACLPHTAEMLPHTTPGSHSWFQQLIAAELREVCTGSCFNLFVVCCTGDSTLINLVKALWLWHGLCRFLNEVALNFTALWHTSGWQLIQCALVLFIMYTCCGCYTFTLQTFLTDERFHRKLNAAGITYDHMDLLKSTCDTAVSRGGSPMPLIKFKR